jgi:hypothetical protein
MRSSLWGLIALLLLTPPRGVAAQAIPEIHGEARVGWAAPAGDLGSGPGFDPESGPTFALGLRLSFTPLVGIYAGYRQTRFGCDTCERLGLDGTAILDGLEAGLHLEPPRPVPYSPWLRAGVLQQQLAFTGFGERLASESSTGFGGQLGFGIPLSPRLHFNPAIGFLSVPADFEFTTVSDRSTRVSAFTIELGAAYRF